MARKRITAKQAAEMVGVKPATWRAYVNRGQAPGPDGREDLSGHPYWFESTVAQYAKTRPGRGARTDLA